MLSRLDFAFHCYTDTVNGHLGKKTTNQSLFCCDLHLFMSRCPFRLNGVKSGVSKKGKEHGTKKGKLVLSSILPTNCVSSHVLFMPSFHRRTKKKIFSFLPIQKIFFSRSAFQHGQSQERRTKENKSSLN